MSKLADEPFAKWLHDKYGKLTNGLAGTASIEDFRDCWNAALRAAEQPSLETKPAAWIVWAKGGKFTRGIYQNPTPEDFAIWQSDGDTPQPLYAVAEQPSREAEREEPQEVCTKSLPLPSRNEYVEMALEKGALKAQPAELAAEQASKSEPPSDDSQPPVSAATPSETARYDLVYAALRGIATHIRLAYPRLACDADIFDSAAKTITKLASIRHLRRQQEL